MRELARPESYRQSLIAAFDSCPRRALFTLLDNRRTPSPLAARGSLFHRWHHRAINEMRAHKEDSMAVEQGMELLAEVLMQSDVADEEVVPLTMREMRWLRVLVAKWCYSTAITVQRIVDVERRLYADITLPNGGTRKITGQLDILQAGPERDGATSVDAKTGFARPKQPRVELPDGKGLTELGWVQSLIYAVLVFANFPSVYRFTFREWHVLWAESREVTIERWEAERMNDVLGAQVALLDQAIAGGVNSKRWTESPGPHCALCPRPRECPIKEEVGLPANAAEAQNMGQEWIVAGAARADRTPYLKGWVDAYGPIEIPYSGGRRFIGWDTGPEGGRNFGIFEPKPMSSPYDDMLVEAAKERGALVT